MLALALFLLQEPVAPATTPENTPAPTHATSAQDGSAAPSAADGATGEHEIRLPPGIDWKHGPTDGNLGSIASVKVPEGYVFAAGEGTRKLLELMQNPPSGRELGVVAPADLQFFVFFEFDDVGYVKDDERDSLDADALLATLRESNERGNEMRRKRGWSTIELEGWQKKPFYDEKTHDLTWALLIGDEGHKADATVNWSARRLGRKGVMRVQLVVDQPSLEATLPKFEAIMSGFDYSGGERYAEFKSGDKIAEYGLAALVAGGGLAVAAKTGLLAKLWKPIALGLVAIASFFRRAWGWITGRGARKQGENAS